MASPTLWTWVWANSGTWGTGKPGMLWSWGLQRVENDLVTQQQPPPQPYVKALCKKNNSHRYFNVQKRCELYFLKSISCITYQVTDLFLEHSNQWSLETGNQGKDQRNRCNPTYRMIFTLHYAMKRHTQNIGSQLELWQLSLAGPLSHYNGILKRVVSAEILVWHYSITLYFIFYFNDSSQRTFSTFKSEETRHQTGHSRGNKCQNGKEWNT